MERYSAKKHFQEILKFMGKNGENQELVFLYSAISFIHLGGESFKKKHKKIYDILNEEMFDIMEDDKVSLKKSELFFTFSKDPQK